MKILALVPSSKFAKNVARDLIYGCWCQGKRIGGISFPPITLILVGTILKQTGHKVRLLDAAAEGINLNLLLKIASRYEAVIILTSTMSINEDAGLLNKIKKKNPNLKTIVFGSHPTFLPKDTLSKEGIDIVVRREPEYIVRDLVSALEKGGLDWKQVKGIGYMEDGEYIINDFYPFIQDLDFLPVPDRRMLLENADYFNPVVKRLPYTTMFTSRGCPGKCTFCSSPSFYGKQIRFSSAERVLKELKIIQKLGYKEVFFRDEMFTLSRKRVKEICKGIMEKNIDLTWICSSRVDALDKEIMSIMKRAGCHMIRLGVESGMQEILDNIKKGIKISQTTDVFKWAHEVGLDTHAHLMLGAPGETLRTIDKTMRFVKNIDPTIVTFGICSPYPGTLLFEQVKEKYPEVGDGSSCDLQNLHTQGFYNQAFTGLSSEMLSSSVGRAYRSFYIRPAYLLRWLFRINSMDELRRVMLAGTQVINFALKGD